MNTLFDNNIVSEYAVEYGLKVKSRNSNFKSHTIKSSVDAMRYVEMMFSDEIEICEMFCVLFLNRANNVVGWSKISQGGRAQTVVDCAMIAKLALDSLAHSVVLMHNHPSGTLRPSPQDNALTSSIKHGLGFLGIKVLDHLIVSPDGGYYSYADEIGI